MVEQDRTGTAKSFFEPFLNQFVKILLSDGDKTSVSRGTIIKISDDFLIVKGDYNEAAVAIRSIVKITKDQKGERWH